jgi:hypothetical protein
VVVEFGVSVECDAGRLWRVDALTVSAFHCGRVDLNELDVERGCCRDFVN